MLQEIIARQKRPDYTAERIPVHSAPIKKRLVTHLYNNQTKIRYSN